MNSPMHALAGIITEKFVAADPKAAAKALESLATHEVLLLIGSLKAQTIVACLNPMDPPKAAAVLRRLPIRQASYVLERMEVAQGARLMKEFSVPYRERLNGVLTPAFVKLLSEASAYAPGSVGLVMNTDVVTVRTEAKLFSLVDRLKALPRKKLPAASFVTGKDGELKGVIRTAELSFYARESVCGSVMNPTEVLHPQDALSSAQETFARAETDALPVVNEKNVLLGVLTREKLAQAFAESEPAKVSFWQRLKK